MSTEGVGGDRVRGRRGGAGRSGRTVWAGGRSGTASRYDRGRCGPGSGVAGRSSRPHGHPDERAAVLHPPERAARAAGVAQAGGRCRFDSGGAEPARACALPRAHGVQRHRELQAGRARRVPRVDWRPVRSARQRVDELRRDDLHAGRAHRSRRVRGQGPARTPRFRRRHGAAASRNREGTGRGSRGVARSPRRRRSHHRSAAPRPAAGLALRRALADRHPRGDQGGSARAGSLVLQEVVSARCDGRDRGRRHRPRGGGEAGARALRGHPEAVGTARERGSDDSAPQGDAVQPGHRSGSTGHDRVGRRQERRAQADDGRRLPRRADATAGRRDAEPALARDRAAARCAVHRRRIQRRYPRPAAAAVRYRRRRSRERAGGGAGGGDARSPPRPAVRLLGRRDRPRPAGDAGRLRARLQRARYDREPALCRRVRASLPRGRAHSRCRARIPHRGQLLAHGHRRRDAGGRAVLDYRREPRRARGRARKERDGAVNRRAPHRHGACEHGHGRAVDRPDGGPRPGRQTAGRRQGHRHAHPFRIWASRSSRSRTGSRCG